MTWVLTRTVCGVHLENVSISLPTCWHPRKSSRSFRAQSLHHSPCGTLISPSVSERKLCVSLTLTDTPSCPSGCIISDLRQYPDYPENKKRQGDKVPLCSPGFFNFHKSPRKDLIAEMYSLQFVSRAEKREGEKSQSKIPLQQNFLVILGMACKWTSTCPTCF